MPNLLHQAGRSLLIGMVLLALAVTTAGHAQDAPPPDTTPYSPPQLDQLLAPIALYPDTLLAQILMAATYPLEVVEAYRWVSDPAHASLQGEALAAALQDQDWDPSVKSLTPFPQILKMMNDQLGWMQQVGDAFLAKQADVMDAIQRLRAQAYAAGTLRSTDKQTVTVQGQTITIVPATTDTVYVPVYDPSVYGAWLYPDYPPDVFVFPGLVVEPDTFVWVPVAVVGVFWGWDHWDWPHHRIHIDPDRFAHLNGGRHRPHVTFDTWTHNPHHRHGVPYRDPAMRHRFRPNPAGPPAPRLDFRGFDNVPHAAPRREPGGLHPAPRPMPRQRNAPMQHQGPPAFEDYDAGSQARAASERGHASRGTMAPSAHPPMARPGQPQHGGPPFKR